MSSTIYLKCFMPDGSSVEFQVGNYARVESTLKKALSLWKGGEGDYREFLLAVDEHNVLNVAFRPLASAHPTIETQLKEGTIGSRITPNSTGVLHIPDDPDIHGLHVTKDPDFWKKRIGQDYDRPVKDAKVINIKVMPGDIFLPDHNMIKSQWGDNPPSAAILVTSRKILKQGEDFYVEGKLAGKR